MNLELLTPSEREIAARCALHGPDINDDFAEWAAQAHRDRCSLLEALSSERSDAERLAEMLTERLNRELELKAKLAEAKETTHA